MHDASTPIVFQRHNHQLRTVMVDNQPWFVAHDFARLIGAQAHEASPGFGIVDGAPLASEVWEEQEPVAARRRGGRHAARGRAAHPLQVGGGRERAG